MTSDEYATLMDFLATRFARMDVRLTGIEDRLTRLEERVTRSEVLQEAMRDDVRRIAEGVTAVNERLDRFQIEVRERFEEHDRRFDNLDRGLGRVQVQFDRFAVDFGTVQLDHGARIEALERYRRRSDPQG